MLYVSFVVWYCYFLYGDRPCFQQSISTVFVDYCILQLLYNMIQFIRSIIVMIFLLEIWVQANSAFHIIIKW